jgi:hypothetical protein
LLANFLVLIQISFHELPVKKGVDEHE